MTDTWFVMIPPGYQDKADSEKELVDFRVQYPAGSQAWNDANAGKILSSSESGEGQQLVKWKGPFTTEAQAQAAQNPQQQSPNPVNDAANAAENSNAFSGIDRFFSTYLLRAVEMLLGLALIAVGVAKLTNAVPAATKIARTLG